MSKYNLPFRANGTNANMIDEILRFIPDPKTHDLFDCWNEPFCQTAVLTLNLPFRFPLMTINDIDGEIVNFFHVLRHFQQSLIHRINFTPYARTELESAYERIRSANGMIERARLFYIRQMMSRNGADKNPNFKRQFRAQDKNKKKMKAAARSFAETDHLLKYAEALRGVQIENLDILEYLRDYDHPRAFFYLDPPFLPETRENETGLYRNEMTIDQHVDFCDRLDSLEGFAILRHYECELYDEIETNGRSWVKVKFDKRTDGDGTKVEALYISPNLWDLLEELQPLHSVEQGELFS